MSIDAETLFPTGLSDEAATALCDCLNALAFAADSHYLHQILRYRSQQQAPLAPNRPWLATLPKP